MAFTFRWPGTAPKPTALEARRAGRCHLSFADRPAYDAHRVLARPCLHPALLGQELIDDKGWGWAAREAA